MRFVITILAAALLAVLTGCPHKETIRTTSTGTEVRRELDATGIMRLSKLRAEEYAALLAEHDNPETTDERRAIINYTLDAYDNQVAVAVTAAVTAAVQQVRVSGDAISIAPKGDSLLLRLLQGVTHQAPPEAEQAMSHAGQAVERLETGSGSLSPEQVEWFNKITGGQDE